MDFGSWNWTNKVEEPTFDIQSLFHPRRLEELRNPPKKEEYLELDHGDPILRLQWSRCVGRFAALRAEISNCWDSHEQATQILSSMRKELKEHTNALLVLQPTNKIDPIPIKADEDATCKSNAHIQALAELNEALQSDNPMWLSSAIKLCRNVNVHENKLQPALKRLDKWEALRDGRSKQFVSFPESVEDNVKSARARSQLRRAMASREPKILKKAILDAESMLCSDERIMMAARDELVVLEARKDASLAIQRALKSRDVNELRNAINLCVWSDFDDGMISKARAALQTEMSQLAAREKLKEAMESNDIEVLACAIEETSNNLLDDPENELGEARKCLAVLKASQALEEAAERGDAVLLERAIEHASRVGVGASEINCAQRELSRLRMSSLLESDDSAQIVRALRRLNSDDSAVMTLRSRLAMLESKKALREAIKSDDPIKIQNTIEQTRLQIDDDDVDMIAAKAALENIRLRMTSSMKEAMQNEDFEALEMLVEEAEIANPVLRGDRTLLASKRRLSDHATQLSEARVPARASLVRHDETALRQGVQLADAVDLEDHEVILCKARLSQGEKNHATLALHEAMPKTAVASPEHALVIAEEKAVDEELFLEGRRVLDERVTTQNKVRRTSFASARDSVSPDGSPTAAKKAQSSAAFLMESFPFFPSCQPSIPAFDSQSPRESEASARHSAGTLPGSRSSAAERARARLDAKDGLAKALESKDREELDLAITIGREAGLTTRELQEAIDMVGALHSAASTKRRADEALFELSCASGAGDLLRLRTLIERAKIEKLLTEFQLSPFIELERDMEAQMQAMERFRENEARCREVKSEIAAMVVENPLRPEEMLQSLQNAEKLGLRGEEVEKARARLDKHKEVFVDMHSNVSNADVAQLQASMDHARVDVSVSREGMLPFEDDLSKLQSKMSAWMRNMNLALHSNPIDISGVRDLLEASPDSQHPLYVRAKATVQAQTEIDHALVTKDRTELYAAIDAGNKHKLNVFPIHDALSQVEQGSKLALNGSLNDVDNFLENSSLHGDHPVMRDLRKRSLALQKDSAFDVRKIIEEREATSLNQQTENSSDGVFRFSSGVGGSVDHGTLHGSIAEQLDQLRADSFMKPRVDDGGGGLVGEGKVRTDSELHGDETPYSGSLMRSSTARPKISVLPSRAEEKEAPDIWSTVLPGFEGTTHHNADLSGGEEKDDEEHVPSKRSCPVCTCRNDATARECASCKASISALHARIVQAEKEEDGGKDETEKNDAFDVSLSNNPSATSHIPQVPATTSDTAVSHTAPTPSETLKTTTSPRQKSSVATEQQSSFVSGKPGDSPAKKPPVALSKSGENLHDEPFRSTKPPLPAFEASFPPASSSKSITSVNQQQHSPSPDAESRLHATSYSVPPSAPLIGTLEHSGSPDVGCSLTSDVSVPLETQQENAYKAICDATRATKVNDVALSNAILVAQKLGLEKTDRGLRAIVEAEQVMAEWKRQKEFQDIIYSKDKKAIQKALKTAPNRDLATEAEAMLENIEQEELQNALDELGENEQTRGEEGVITVAANEWQCAVCSLLNDNSNLICAACETPNPLNSGPLGEASSSTLWECPSCTFQNQPEHRRCDACGSKNPARSAPQRGAPWTCTACTTEGNIGRQCGTCGSPPPARTPAAPAPTVPTRADGVRPINWGPFKVNDRVKATDKKLKWEREGNQIPANRSGSFFKVERGSMGFYVGTRDNQAMVEWNRKGKQPFLGAVEPSQVVVV